MSRSACCFSPTVGDGSLAATPASNDAARTQAIAATSFGVSLRVSIRFSKVFQLEPHGLAGGISPCAVIHRLRRLFSSSHARGGGTSTAPTPPGPQHACSYLCRFLSLKPALDELPSVDRSQHVGQPGGGILRHQQFGLGALLRVDSRFERLFLAQEQVPGGEAHGNSRGVPVRRRGYGTLLSGRTCAST